MKHNRLLRLAISSAVVFSCLFLPSIVRADEGDVEINEENFPDGVFRQAVLTEFDRDKDGILNADEIQEADYLEIEGVEDLTGMSYLSNMSSLTISNSNIKKISFDFEFRELGFLEIIKCPELTEVSNIVSQKELILTLSSCKKLKSIDLENIDYKHLQLTSCTSLESLDLSHLNYLERLELADCPLTESSLDLTAYKDQLNYLRVVRCGNIKDINVSGCKYLWNIYLFGDQIERINIDDCPLISSLDLGSTSVKELDVSKAESLNCAVLYGAKDQIEPFYENHCYQYVIGQAWCIAPINTTFITDKKTEYLKASDVVEDENLAEAVTDNCDSNKDRMLSKRELEAFSTLKVKVSKNTIRSLKGLEYFTAITEFETDHTDYDVIDLRYLPNCKKIQFWSINANKLIVPDNSRIADVYMFDCYFGSDMLDLGHQEDLYSLECREDRSSVSEVISRIDISGCPKLVYTLLNASKTEITHLDNTYRSDIGYIMVSAKIGLKVGMAITASASHGIVKGTGGNFMLGDKVHLTQIPDDGYVFKGWYENGKLLSTEPSLDFVVTCDRHLVAKFEPASATVKPTVKPTSKPSVTVKPTGAAKPTSSTKPTSSVQPTGSVRPTGAVKPTGAVVPTASPDGTSQIADFVKRIYTYVLDREPEAEGATFWTDELYSFRRTGAEVGLGFIFSDEFTSRGLSDGDYVTVLYRTFFGREPEEDGFRFWTSALADGALDRMGVANGFVYSQEWADTCARYGIRSGGEIKPSVEIEPTDATFAFVERMYTTAMNRASDEEGKKFWANELSNFRFTGEQVGVMFFLSDEMNGFNLSDEEFVTRLYKTFMDRDPEEGGFNFWVGYLAYGGSRSDVVYGFTRSEEFVSKCIEARILPY